MMHRLQYFLYCVLLLLTVIKLVGSYNNANYTENKERNVHEQSTMELPIPLLGFRKLHEDQENDELQNSVGDTRSGRSHRLTLMDMALQASVREGIEAMTELYGKIEPEIFRNGQLLAENHPASILSKFSAPTENTTHREMAAYAAITATKAFKKNYKQIDDLARQAHTPKISLRRTALEGLCPPRDPPICTPASERYRTHDGTCNNQRRLRWGAAQMPFNRFLPPEYGDGVDTIRNGANDMPLSSSRFVSLLVHGAKDGDAPLTLMTAQWGQLLDHDMTSTAQPRSINGSVPSCCSGKDFHPSCFPIKVPLDDPWLAPLKVRCLEFLRSAPAQRRDCVLSWREQTNQATSYIDASPIYSSNSKSSDNARTFRKGLLIFGRGNPAQDVCQRGALARQCIRSGDGRSGEQPGLLALHQVWVGEHNRIATELSELNLHWSDEKIYQEARRIVGAMFQHITYREFLPIILGREVCKLFELELKTTDYYDGYDPKTNPTVANSFAAAAFRFGHSLIQDSYMRCDRHHNRINNSVSLHEEFQRGDIGSAGSLHRLIRGLATQRALRRDEFISPELTNHLFQTPGFPFGLDLAAINIQRGRDHGIAPYTSWRVPCGLTPINSWNDFANIVGPESAKRIGHAYRSVHDIDLFVGGISERPVLGGLVGPTFACIIAQQFSNSRKGDRFWYENRGFESSFTPAQLHSIRRVSLSQVLCRTVGGGTFQPNIFIPHVFPGNERLPCGTGPLTPIDLSPWLEQDPFGAPLSSETVMETTVPDRVFDIISDTNSLTGTQMIKEDKTGFNNLMSPFANMTTIQEQHMAHTAMVLQRPLNASKINDKLDFKRKTISTKRPTPRPMKGVNNKLDKTQVSNFNVKSVNHVGRPAVATTTRRTVVIENIPIELRTTLTNETVNTNSNTTKGEKVPIRRTTNKKKKKNKNSVKITNKLMSRADNVKQVQSENRSATKDKIISDEEHTNDEKLKIHKDETVFDDGDTFARSKENFDSTSLQIDLDAKNITEDKTFEETKATEKPNPNDNKNEFMTGLRIDEEHMATITTTIVDELHLLDLQLPNAKTWNENGKLTSISLNTVKTETQDSNLKTNEQLKTVPKQLNKIQIEQNLAETNDQTINEVIIKTEPKRTNETQNDQNSTETYNQEINQQLKTKPKETNETESNQNSTQNDDEDINQQLKTELKNYYQIKNDQNSINIDQEIHQQIKTVSKQTNEIQNDQNSTQKDDPEINQQLKMEPTIIKETENDQNSTQIDDKNLPTMTEETENAPNSIQKTQKINPEINQQLKMEPTKTKKTENDQNSTQIDDQNLPTMTEKTENAPNSIQKDDQNIIELKKTEPKYINETENDQNYLPNNDQNINELMKNESKKTNETDNDQKTAIKNEPKIKQQQKMATTMTKETNNDRNSIQKDDSVTNEQLTTEPTRTKKTKTNKHSTQAKDDQNTNQQLQTELKKNTVTENDQNSTLNDSSKTNQQLKTELKKTNPIENNQSLTQKDDQKNKQQQQYDPTRTKNTENDPNSTQKTDQQANPPIGMQLKPTTVNETFSLKTDTEDVTKNQAMKSSANSTNKQQLKIELTSDIIPNSEKTTKQPKEDNDIDPLTHSSTEEHKRVQRKVTHSKTKTDIRNVTNPKILRVNITNQNLKLVTSFKLFSLKNRTAATTKVPKVTKQSKTTEPNLELRQYQTRPIYTRPQKVIVEGPNSDQYEIEINIRQTNKSPAMQPTLNYADYTTPFKPFGYDRYTNYADYQSTTPAYGYYRPDSTIASNFVQPQRTRPPTVIYLDEHDERTTTKQPSLLQNFLSFAASGFGANRRPTGPSNGQKEKEKPIFSHNSLSGGSLTSTLVSGPHNSASSSQYGSDPQRQPITSSSFSQVGAYPGTGAAHAASGAVSSGNFGSIMGIANANGADSTFSFNIRPRPPPETTASGLSNSGAGGYGLVPQRRPEYGQFSRPDFNNLPLASYSNEQYFAQQTHQAPYSPFSTTGNKKPLQQSYFSRFAMDPQEKAHNTNDMSRPMDHKIDIHDFDYLTKTLEPIVNGGVDVGSDGDDDDDSDDLDNDYEYDDIEQLDDDLSSKKFNRDGYIRPEFMIESLLKSPDIEQPNITHDNNSNNSNFLLDDNFVLPVWNNSKKVSNDLVTPLPTDLHSTKTTTTSNPVDSLPKHANNDILAEDYDENSNSSFIEPKTDTLTVETTIKKLKNPLQNASFAPITILTKPERPDNWVIYETPVEKPLLPEIPEIKSDSFSASEVPMPFNYRNKNVENRRPNLQTPSTTEDIITETLTDVTTKTTDIQHVDNITDNRYITSTNNTSTTTEGKLKTDNT